jgi:hypothetical protein
MYAKSEYAARMKQITLRKVNERAIVAAKERARERGVAMNAVLVEALERGLGIHPGTVTNGLESLAGDSDFGEQWDERMRELEKVNPEDWKCRHPDPACLDA